MQAATLHAQTAHTLESRVMEFAVVVITMAGMERQLDATVKKSHSMLAGIKTASTSTTMAPQPQQPPCLQLFWAATLIRVIHVTWIRLWGSSNQQEWRIQSATWRALARSTSAFRVREIALVVILMASMDWQPPTAIVENSPILLAGGSIVSMGTVSMVSVPLRRRQLLQLQQQLLQLKLVHQAGLQVHLGQMAMMAGLVHLDLQALQRKPTIPLLACHAMKSHQNNQVRWATERTNQEGWQGYRTSTWTSRHSSVIL
mmetsp:Transcript_25264/g.44154  ORF Transcript_25264/g.44154 Transcript_25264/m.44154 type:complete len:258 (-) Transcript_25264:152-925(-)